MEDIRLEARVGAALAARGWMACAAESCTGGMLLHRLTNIAGSSAYVAGGVVSYSNEAKQRLLGVKAETLAAYGAVSPETAREMVEGALRVFNGDVGISITGIAGPTGAQPNKPVGLTYIAIAVPSQNLLRVDEHLWNGDRETNKFYSVNEALLKLLAVAE